MRFYVVPLYSLVFCGFGAPPFMFPIRFPGFVCYYIALLYTVNVPFSRL